MNILSGSAKDDLARLLRERGYQILGKNQRELVETRVAGRVTMGEVIAEYTVAKGGKKFVVVSAAGDPSDPALRRRLIEYDRAFGLHGVLTVDPAEGTVAVVTFKYPRERGLDFYFQFFAALFVLAVVIGIIWLMVAVKLF